MQNKVKNEQRTHQKLVHFLFLLQAHSGGVAEALFGFDSPAQNSTC
jgi:hypothetical protein